MARSTNLFLRSGTSAASVTALLMMAACGGGGGGSNGSGFPFIGVAPPPATAPQKAKVKVKVTEDSSGNVPVFLDKNNNGVLDADEPNAKTDASGNATLEIDPTDVGTAPVVALVGNQVFKAPADEPGVVSPLTTLVQQLNENAGVTSAEAEANLRVQLGLEASLLADYTGGDARSAVTAAFLVQVAQKISANLAGSVGQPDISGGVITAGDISKEIQNMLLDKPTTIRHLLGTPFALSSCGGGVSGSGCKELLDSSADYYATNPNENKLTAATIGTAVGASKLIAAAVAPTDTSPPVAAGALDWFSLSDNTNWYRRIFVSTAAESTPVDGATLFREVRMRNTAGVLSTWSLSGSPARSTDLHWNGSGWVGCAFGFQNITSVRDAQGRSFSDYCDGVNISKNKRASIDISGRKLSEVINQIKAYPYTNSGPYGTRYAFWGPNADAATVTSSLGDAVFPAGSALYFQGALDLSSAPSYNIAESAKVLVSTLAVAEGGNSQTDPGVACGAANNTQTKATSLEEVIERSPGKPCVNAPGTLAGTAFPSGDRNDGWTGTSLSMGILGSAPLGTAATATDYYTGNTPIRVSFAGNGSTAVTFYECRQRAINGSVRNCDVVGTGVYKITQLGDARVMSFSAVPGLASHQDYEGIVIERAGEVIYGYQSKPVAKKQIRLNLAASNAVFAAYSTLGAVGLEPVVP